MKAEVERRKAEESSEPGALATGADVHPITGRAIVAGAATSALLCVYANYIGVLQGSGSLVKEQFSMASFLPFVGWLFLNALLKRWLPRLALSQAELLLVFSMAWMSGTIAVEGWVTYWVGISTTPTYFASPENRWREVLFDLLPWWALPEGSPGVIRQFQEGLTPGASLPWAGWVGAFYWWFTVSAAVMTAGLCVIVLFQRQWVEAERLTFPLAVMPVDLTEGFDRGMPQVFRERLFRVGFGVVFGVFLWNLVYFFSPGWPRITLFDGYLSKEVRLGQRFPSLYLRVLPSVIGLTFLCDTEILLSLWLFGVLALLKVGLMTTLGVAVGETGQQAGPAEVVNIESHGAMTFLVAWSVYVARNHLRGVWQAARRGDGTYRLALVGLLASTIYIVGWMIAVGHTPFTAFLQVGLIFIAYFAVVKYTAASGFAYLFPVAVKGQEMIEHLAGTSWMSAGQIVGARIVSSGLFYGNSRIPTLPGATHHLKLFEGGRMGRVVGTVFLSFAVGFFASTLSLVYMGYEHGGRNLGTWGMQGGNVQTFDLIVSEIEKTDRPSPDAAKWAVWLVGGAEAGLLTFLRGRFPWWPIHPLGLAFQYTSGPRIYAFSIFLVWAAKTLLLRLGGVALYRRARPFFYGVVVGYVSGIGVSALVDTIWFRGDGHSVHGW